MPQSRHSASSERARWGWLAGLTVLAAALRLPGLDQQLWYDEMVLAVRWMPLGLGEIATTYTSQNQHMLYSLLARVAVELFGEHNWVLRLPAVLFGVACVPALYFCARVMNARVRGRAATKERAKDDAETQSSLRGAEKAQQAARGENGGAALEERRRLEAGGTKEALLAAALLAVSYHHVWFSQNARGYTGLALWTLVTTYFFLRGMNAGVQGRQDAGDSAREGGLRPWLWYGITLALGMYTHLTMGFVAAGQFVAYMWMVIATRRTETEFAEERNSKFEIRNSRTLIEREPAAAVAQQAAPEENGGKPPHSRVVPLVGFALAGMLTLALYAPVLPEVFARTIGAQAGGAVTEEAAAGSGGAAGAAIAAPVQSEWTNPVWLLLETARGLAAGAGGLGYVVLPVGALLLLTGLVSYWKQDRFVVGLMVIPGVITAAVMLLLGHNLWPRFFFFAIGFGMMLLVRGAMVCAEFVAQKVQSLRPSDGKSAYEGGASAEAGLAENKAGAGAPALAHIRRRRRLEAGATWGRVVVGLMILASAWSVRSAWMYPKQDFEGALEFVEWQRQAGEPVVLAGLAVFPFREYYQRDWPAVTTRAEWEAARAGAKRVWLVYASPIFV
ncbi:MAG: glycosyltransferase family 39 protein, partial [Candidatus Acidiferrales bacterium]